MIKLFKRLRVIGFIPLSHDALLALGYTYHPIGYYCPPAPADCGMYRINKQAVIFNNNLPKKGTEEWRAYLTSQDLPTIRRFKTLSELNYFHRAMCGTWLF
jgi:hypothetical protein